MSWGSPEWIWVGLLVLALVAIVIRSTMAHRHLLRSRFSGALFDRVLPLSVRIRRSIRDVALLLGLALIVMAMAEPRFGKTVVEMDRRGVDIVLCLDLSRSMAAEDVDPSRLERMRREVSDLLDQMEGDRIGMVIYAGGAYPRTPLTADHDAIRLLAQELSTESFHSQGSELGQALRQAMVLLGQDTAQAGQAIIVMSDGEVHRVDDALAAAREAQQRNIRIYGLGIGTKESPIPLPDGTWLLQEGQTVITTPSHGVLKDVARLTGGAFVQSIASDEDVKKLYHDEIRENLESAQYDTIQREVWNTGFQWPLGIAVFLLLIASWLGDGRKRATGGLAAAFLAAIVFGSPDAMAQDKADGDAAYRSGQYALATEVFEQLAAQHPDDPDVFSRLGASRFRAGDYDGAARAWETQSRLAGPDATDALYNAAIAQYKAGRLEESIEQFDRVLAQRPRHQRASDNKDLVVQDLAARRQQQQEQEEKQDGEGGQAPEGEGDQSQDEQKSESSEGDSEGEDKENQTDDAEGDPSGESDDEQEGSPDEQQQAEQSDGGSDQEQDSESVGLDELDDVQEGDQGDAEGVSDQVAEEGKMTPEQAAKLLEGVKEGRPRIEIPPGAKADKPW